MNYETYTDLIISKDYSVIDFESVGPCGKIPKRIAFFPTSTPNVYNLTYGNLQPNGQIDDRARSNNGDRNKILATVAVAIDLYTSKYPHRMIAFEGSTKERTRLYRMAVGLHLEFLSDKFIIYAQTGAKNELVLFRKNMNINIFFIKRKKT